MEIKFKNSYNFPDYFKWPFFFTIQINADTRLKQLNMWANLTKDFCKANKIWRISKTFFKENVGKNESINRRLTQEGIDIIFSYMRDIAKCAVQIGNEDYYIMWKSLQEWEDCFYDVVNKHHRVDSLETLEYLMNDEEMKNEEFFGIDKELLVKILTGLESKRKCSLLKDETGCYVGVKFLKI